MMVSGGTYSLSCFVRAVRMLATVGLLLIPVVQGMYCGERNCYDVLGCASLFHAETLGYHSIRDCNHGLRLLQPICAIVQGEGKCYSE